MSLMPRLSVAVWALLAVLVVAIAGITHIVTVLALPWRSDGDAYARIAKLAPATGAARLGAPPEGLPFSDPAMATQVCRYDLGAAPFRLALSPLTDGFVTIGFHSRHGITFYGLTVRASDASAFDLVLSGKPEDRGGDAEERTLRKVVVVTPEPTGFVTVATPLGEDGARTAADERLAKVECRADASPAP